MSVSLLHLLGSSNPGGGSSTTIKPVAYEFRLQSTTSLDASNQSLIPAKIIADDQGNVYGVTNFEYFKVSKFGYIAWVKNIPSIYTTGLTTNNKFQNIAISPNGGYLVVIGEGGDEGSTGYGSEIIASHIDVNDGNTIKHYKVKDSTVPESNRIATASDVTVEDTGICNVVGNLYRLGDAPYNEFCRLVIDLTTETIITAIGDTNGTYMEGWKDLDSNGTKIIMGGLDVQNVQPGFQTHNWTLAEYNTGTNDWSKTWQSNSGNGVVGYGVCITNDATPKIFAGYGDQPLQQSGIMELSYTTGSPTEYINIHYNSGDRDDIYIQNLTTDGTNVYFSGYNYNGIVTGESVHLIGCIDIATKTIQWSNTLTRSSSFSYGFITKIRYNTGSGKLDVSGSSTPSSDGTHTAYILELPTDGTGTGKYGSYAYEPVNLTKSTGNSSWYSGSPTLSTYSSTSTVAGGSESDSSDVISWQLKSDYGHDEFIIPGTYNWKCPEGVTSVCVAAVGAGGSGTVDNGPGGGGGGAGLGWKNDISVTPGTTYTVVVGNKATPQSGGDGGDSYFISTSTVCGFGGDGNSSTKTGGNGGSYTGQGGGNGGDGGTVNNANGGNEAGGGGAGGYTGAGGEGGGGNGITITQGSGGGADGSGGAGGGGGYGGGYCGGGVRLQGEGASGRGGTYYPTDQSRPFGQGETGSYDQQPYIYGSDAQGNKSGLYGAGGAGAQSTTSLSGHPGTGAVRIVWGYGRSFPDTNVGNDVVEPEGPEPGSQEWTSGSHTWTAPAGVTSVCVVCIGGGGGGGGGYTGNGAGGGGALTYGNDIPVIPGSTYNLQVGSGGGSGFYFTGHPSSPNDGTNGGDSWFMDSATLFAGGGTRGVNGGINGGSGGISRGTAKTGGGNGGDGGDGSYPGTSHGGAGYEPPQPWSGGGGGGAGGYSGTGGNGGDSESNGSDASGGGGGGGGASSGYFTGQGGNGGGVDKYGEGISGHGAAHFTNNDSQNGVGGSGATSANHGGGGRGGAGGRDPSAGSGGAIRIIWGDGRAFPNTDTEEPSTDPPATEPTSQEWITPGLYKWLCPTGVTSVSSVVVGGGAGGDGGHGRYSGGGGNLRYKNNITVTPGNFYDIFVGSGGRNGAGGYHNSTDIVRPSGANGSDSYFISTGTCYAQGGLQGSTATGGLGDGGGNGGSGYDTGSSGSSSQVNGPGGGGAGGYSGNGGNAPAGSTAGQQGSGGGGGSGAGGTGNPSVYTITAYSGFGGGVELYGEGTSGSGGTVSSAWGDAFGERGSADKLPADLRTYEPSYSYRMGGGGFMGSKTTQSGQTYNWSLGGGEGGHGGVRLIWDGKTFPIPDYTHPTATITSPQTSVEVSGTMVISFDLSESSADFVVGDINVTNGSLSNFTGSGSAYTAIFTPVATAGVTATISIASNAFSDAQGNFNQDGNDSDNSIDINIIADPVVGQQAYTGVGSYQWTAPAGVTSVCVVCVGGGGSGGANSSGGGGGLGWKNNITVVPGQNYSVVVGGSSGQSYFINNTTVQGGGGVAGITNSGPIPVGGTFVGDGGGDGGTASSKWGGGGAGGYSGTGGTGGINNSVPPSPTDGSGGGGAGGGQGGTGTAAGSGGGGVGILGQGANGTVGSTAYEGGNGGSGGSNGTGGGNGYGGNGGEYGGGGGVGDNGGGSGASGAVRIIWGSGRAFPSTNTADQ